jgi:hypothetical protein
MIVTHGPNRAKLAMLIAPHAPNEDCNQPNCEDPERWHRDPMSASPPLNLDPATPQAGMRFHDVRFYYLAQAAT